MRRRVGGNTEETIEEWLTIPKALTPASAGIPAAEVNAIMALIAAGADRKIIRKRIITLLAAAFANGRQSVLGGRRNDVDTPPRRDEW